MTIPDSSDLHLFPDAARDLLAFWFDQPPQAIDRNASDRARLQKVRKDWFQKSDEFDALCRTQFGPLCEQALAGELDAWEASADAALARILLLDQITRNIYRGTAKSFAGDAQALASSRHLISRGALDHLTPLEQVFALLPLEHSEALADQEESVRLFEALARQDPQTASNADYARRHRDVVARFGRFPHRNAILGRPSTPEELEFLKQPGSSF